MKMDEMKIYKKYEKISTKTDFYKNKNNEYDHLAACENCSKFCKK